MTGRAVSSIDQQEFRRALGAFATGITIVTTRSGGEIHGMTANAFTSVSLDPPLILVSVDRKARLLGEIERAGDFAVSVLTDEQEAWSRHFARQPQGDGVEFAPEWLPGEGPPLVPGALAHLRCRVERLLDGGDHVLVLGRVEEIAAVSDRRGGLLYYRGQYRRLPES
jgi:flavin reductase (DIM6/NTAB) family NADH-FMN oxidoreductase RutF